MYKKIGTIIKEILLYGSIFNLYSLGGQMSSAVPSVDLSRGPLKNSANNHFIVHADGTPFFYLGDTAWELFVRLTREEAELYLENRRQKCFTVIQCVILAELEGSVKTNRYNQKALIDNDPLKPNEEYFKHVDSIIDKAAEKGLYMAILPTWGGWIYPRTKDIQIQGGDGSIFKTEEQCYNYGNYLGKRYKNRNNIIWCLGGDRQVVNDFLSQKKFDSRPLWRAMAEGIADGVNGVNKKDNIADYSTTFMTFHEYACAHAYFNNDEWLDMNMFGTYHLARNDPRAYTVPLNDWDTLPTRPTLNGEPAYENHPINWNPANGYFDEFDVRQIAYWSVFAGCCGHTYGCHDIWQFYDLNGKFEYVTSPRTEWKKAMNLPGASQMQYLRKLIESRPMLSRIPDMSMIVGGQESGAGHIVATRGDGYAFIYIPTGNNVSVALGKISATRCKATWYNPSTGEVKEAGEFDNSGEKLFDPPGNPGRGNDWVLVIDDISKNYPQPGTYYAANWVGISSSKSKGQNLSSSKEKSYQQNTLKLLSSRQPLTATYNIIDIMGRSITNFSYKTEANKIYVSFPVSGAYIPQLPAATESVFYIKTAIVK